MKTYEEIAATLAPWTQELMDAAWAEGWDLFTATGSTSDVQIQRIDDPDELERVCPGATHLASDDAAMVIVRCGTGEHHRIARQVLQEHYLLEFKLVEDAYQRSIERN